MRVDVALTPPQALPAQVGVVVDVMRATSTIAQALASGYRRVLCCGSIEEAVAVRDEVGEGILGGERNAVLIPGFDLAASPRDYLEPRAETLIMTTTNGTAAILRAVTSCEHILLGSLLNLDAVAMAAREPGKNVTVFCAGFQGVFAIDDAYCAGRIVALLNSTELTDAAVAAVTLARAFPSAWEGVNARTYGPPAMEDDLHWCTQENTLTVVPRFSQMVGPAAEIVSS